MTADEAEALNRGASSEGAGRNPGMARAGAEAGAACSRDPKSERDLALSQVVERGNMQRAYSRVMGNRGAPGIDGMRCEDLLAWLKANWPRVKAQLLEGTYQPQAVRKVDIPKPQGGPLSPLLSNILLTDLDRELERRELSFCRYADDCNVYVNSQRAGQRIMAGISRFLAKRLKLTVNEAKSAVARPWERKFLGYSVTSQRASKIRIAKQSIDRLKARVRELCCQGRGRSLPRIIDSMNPLLRGWMNYFSLTQSRRPIEELDAWLRRRLRSIVWRQWKRPKTREAKMRAHGLDAQRAWKSSVNGRGPWWNAGAKHMIAALPPKYFTQLGLVSLVATHQHLQRPV